jgi:hypothetical protein
VESASCEHNGLSKINIDMDVLNSTVDEKRGNSHQAVKTVSSMGFYREWRFDPGISITRDKRNSPGIIGTYTAPPLFD